MPPVGTRTRPPPPPPPPPLGLPRAAAALPPLITPKLHVRLTRMFTERNPWATPKLRGMISSPGSGVRLKFPNAVHLIFGLSQLALADAKLGRSVSTRSRFESMPVTILKGGAEEAMMNGLSEIFHGALMVPLRLKR